MSFDFTLTTYRQLLNALKQSGYSFYTFEDWCLGNAHGRYVILRHDVDLKAGNSLVIAGIEAEMGIRATYYFRVIPQSNKPEIIKSIVELGHEIGYHYEDLSLYKGDKEKAIEHFKTQLEYFRQFYQVRTICMHGSPTSKWDNRNLWKTYDYRIYGLLGEPYLDFLNRNQTSETEFKYFTDTARMWNGDNFNVRDKLPGNSHLNDTIKNPIKTVIHSTFDFIEWLKSKPSQNVIMITTHPQRWTNNYTSWLMELLKQNLKNIIKRFIISLR